MRCRLRAQGYTGAGTMALVDQYEAIQSIEDDQARSDASENFTEYMRRRSLKKEAEARDSEQRARASGKRARDFENRVAFGLLAFPFLFGRNNA